MRQRTGLYFGCWMGLAGLLAVGLASPNALADINPTVDSLSVTVTASPTNPPSVIMGQLAGPVTLTATAHNLPSGPYGSQAQVESWAWGYSVEYAATSGQWSPAPQGVNINISPPPPTNPTQSTLTASFDQAGYWRITPTATVTVRDALGNSLFATGTADQAIVVTVVGIEKIQFQLPGKSFQDMPLEGLYVAAGTTVGFKAVPVPAGATWPAGKPVWGGSCGASGTGETTSVALNSPSQSMSDTQTITAECGNTISSTIVRYGPNQGTLDIDWENEQSSLVVYKATYKLWVPDFDGTGRPYASGGFAVLHGMDFNNVADLPDPPPLFERARWAFSNGESYSQTTAAFSVEIYQPWLFGYGTDYSSRRPVRSLYEELEAERSDSAGLLGQPAPDPLDAIIAKLVKELVPGKEVADEVLKELKDSFKKQNVDITPSGKETATTNIIISATETQEAKLTVTGGATQVPAALAAKLGVKLLLAANAKAEGTLGQFTKDGKTYYTAPFVGIADVIRDLGKVQGPRWPNAGNFNKEAAVDAGPTGWKAERPKINRTGFIYGALNYATTDDPRVIFQSNKFGVTTAIKARDGLPVLYYVEDSYKAPIVNFTLTGIDDPKGHDHYVYGALMPGGQTVYWAKKHELKVGYEADLLSKKLTINWK